MATPIRPDTWLEVVKTPYGRLSRVKSESEVTGMMHAMVNWKLMKKIGNKLFNKYMALFKKTNDKHFC